MEKLTGKYELIEVESILIAWLKLLFFFFFKEFQFFCHRTLSKEKYFLVSTGQKQVRSWGNRCDACQLHMGEK